MLDGNVLLRQKRDEVPEGTLSCTHRTMASNNEYGHRWGLRLHPCRSDSELIQWTLIIGKKLTMPKEYLPNREFLEYHYNCIFQK